MNTAANVFWRDGIDPESEPLKILIARGELVDPTRQDRSVPYKIYHPMRDDGSPFGAGDLPLVVWSHGLGGSRDGAGFLARFLAAQGYVVMNIQHRGTDSALWEGKPGHPWDNIRKAHIPRSATLDRFRDVPFVLDSLSELRARHPDSLAAADTDRIGMSGHSFGAMTTQVMAGQMFPLEDGALASFREPRFTAGILYSPVPARHLTDAPEDDVYGPVSIPLFHMTGTDDSSPVEGFGFERRLAVRRHARGPGQHLMILKDGDHMVFQGSRGQLGENPKRAAHETILKIAALAFWDSMLKDDRGAAAWLSQGGFAGWMSGEGEYAPPGIWPPGF